MSIRFKILAAVLGLAVAGGAAADASAKTVVAKTVVAKTKIVAHHGGHLKGARIVVHPRHFGTRIVKRVKVVKTLRQAPASVKVVKNVRVGTPALRPLHHAFYGKRLVTHARIVKHVVRAHVAKTVLKTKKIVRINKAPLQRHAMVHRTVAKTVIR